MTDRQITHLSTDLLKADIFSSPAGRFPQVFLYVWLRGSRLLGDASGMTAIGSQSILPTPKFPAELFGYRIVECIGRGAASLVYRVVQPDTKKAFYLKHVVRRSEKDDRFIEQLENEYEVGRRATHRGLRRSLEFKVNRTILRVPIDAGMVLELFEGKTLGDAPIRSLIESVDCFKQVAEALAALHQMGYVHCDLKPSNIIRNEAGLVKVIDLGQACAIGTAKKRVQGTPDYIAPEQVKCLAVTPKTDVYNFGATMYWALTGKNIPTLFTLEKGENSFLVDGQIDRPRDLNPNIPQQLSDLVMECSSVNPAKRPELSDVLRRLDIVDHIARRDDRRPSPSALPQTPAEQPMEVLQSATQVRQQQSEPPLTESPMSNLGVQLQRAMATIRQQNGAVQQLRQAVADRDARLAGFESEKQAAFESVQAACAARDAEVEQLTKQLAGLQTTVAAQTRQLDAIKRILGDLPDDEDARIMAEFNKMFPNPAPGNGKPVPVAAGQN
jgi:serine/threonine-protein kinase